MLDYKEHLLACLGEECGEVSQIVGKSSRFGSFDAKHQDVPNNIELMRKEVHDIISVYRDYCRETGHKFEIDESLLDAKRRRVHLFMLRAYISGNLDVRGRFFRILTELPADAIPDKYVKFFKTHFSDFRRQLMCLLPDMKSEKESPVHHYVIAAIEKYIAENES